MKRTLMILAAASVMFAGHAAALKPGDAAAGKDKAQACMACHGPEVNNPTFPRIAGQHADYLYHALKAYKNGDRQNAVMSGQVAGLSQQDMADLATYFSTLDSGLESISRN